MRTSQTQRLSLKPARLLVLLGLTWIIGPAAYAHTTAISGDVAGTWHVEPNHNPTAGEPALVWVALTKAGGNLIPLDQCDCQLTVHQGPSTDSPAILFPELEAIEAEIYEGIPGATVVFPEVGQYELELAGAPQGGETFQPFSITYTVTVAQGQAQPPSTASPPPPSIGSEPGFNDNSDAAPDVPSHSTAASPPVTNTDTATDAIASSSSTSPPQRSISGPTIGIGLGVAAVLIGVGAIALGNRNSRKS